MDASPVVAEALERGIVGQDDLFVPADAQVGLKHGEPAPDRFPERVQRVFRVVEPVSTVADPHGGGEGKGRHHVFYLSMRICTRVLSVFGLTQAA